MIRAGAAQILAELGRPENNLELIGEHVRALAADGAQLVALPEAMNAGYLFDDREHALALGETLDGPFIAGLGELADSTGTWLACGITERDGARLFNSAVLVGPEVGLVACHRKVNLAPHDRQWFSVGDGTPAVADTPLGRLGLFICFDSRLPWVARNLALAGAELLVNCANFFSEDKAALHLPVRAAENGLPVLAASKAGHERAARYQGGTCAIDADGTVIDVLGPDVTNATLLADLELAPKTRDERLASRRPQAYHVLESPYVTTKAAEKARQAVVVADTCVQVAAVQGTWAQPEALEARLDEVAILGAKIWVLPSHPCGEPPADALAADVAADSAPALFAAIGRATVRADAWCVLSTVVRDPAGPASVLAIVGPDGQVRTARPVHPDPAEPWSSAGEEWLVADTPWGRLGVLGSADLAHPESARCLALLGADLLCVPAATNSVWLRDLAPLERSSESRCHVAMANRPQGCDAPGRSVVVPLTGFPTAKPGAVGRALVDETHRVVAGFVELATARNKCITSGTHLFERSRVEETV